jgi:hypothetical protein
MEKLKRILNLVIKWGGWVVAAATYIASVIGG